MEFTRYAVYFTPPPGPLADFGAAWLGWDAAAGRHVPHPEIAGLPAPVSGLTAAPRRYGLHATIVPPFRLAPGQSEAALRDALAAFCATRPAVLLPGGLTIARLSGFLALVPAGAAGAAEALAARAVRTFERCRARPGAGELARRRAGGLSPRQEAQLQRWGYPYVMEQFRFHITLSGPLPRAQADALRAALAPALEPLVPAPFVVGGLALMGEDETGLFHVIHRYPLSG